MWGEIAVKLRLTMHPGTPRYLCVRLDVCVRGGAWRGGESWPTGIEQAGIAHAGMVRPLQLRRPCVGVAGAVSRVVQESTLYPVSVATDLVSLELFRTCITPHTSQQHSTRGNAESCAECSTCKTKRASEATRGPVLCETRSGDEDAGPLQQKSNFSTTF